MLHIWRNLAGIAAAAFIAAFNITSAEAACPGPVDLQVGYDFDFGAKTGIAPASAGTCVAGSTSPAIAGDDYCSANTTNATNGDYVIRTADFGTATLKYSFPVGSRQENYTITVDIPGVGETGHTASAAPNPRAAGADVATWSGLPSFCSGPGSAITNGGRRLICNVGTVDATGGPLVIAVPASFKVSPRAYNGERFSLRWTSESSGGIGGACTGEPVVSSQALTISARPSLDIKTSIYSYAPVNRSGVPGYLMSFNVYGESPNGNVNVGGEAIVNPFTFNVGLSANVATPGVVYSTIHDYWENTTKMATVTAPNSAAGGGAVIPVTVVPENPATNINGVTVPCASEFLVSGGACIYNQAIPYRVFFHAVEYFVPLTAFGANSQINFTSFVNSDGSGAAAPVLLTPASGSAPLPDPIASNSGQYTAVKTLGGTWAKYTDEFVYDNGLVRPPNSVDNNSWVRMPGELTSNNWCVGGECKQYPGRPVESMIHIYNRSDVPWTNTIVCDKFDNRGMVLTPAARKPGYGNHLYPDNMQTNPITGMYAGVTAATIPDGYIVEVATAPGTPSGGGYPADSQGCYDADATWVDAGTVTDFTPYNMVRLKIPTVASVFGAGVHPYISPEFRFSVPFTAPDGEYIGNQVLIRTDTENFGGGVGQWNVSRYNPQTNNGVYTGERFQVVKALVRISKDAFNTATGAQTSIIGAGKAVTFALKPTYNAGPGVSAPDATLELVDTLPVQMTYKLGTGHICVGGTPTGGLCTGGTLQPFEPNSISVNGSGQQVLTWVLPNVVLNSAIPTVFFDAETPLTTPLGTVLTNSVVVNAPTVDQSPVAERTATRALTVDSIAGFFTTKKVSFPLIPRNGDFTFTLEVANLKSSTETNVDIIDVLPRSGDPRVPASAFGGNIFLTGPVTGPAATVYYTNAAVGQPPTAATSTIGGISGAAYAPDFAIAINSANGWCLASEFGNPGCPASFAAVTGVRAIFATIPGSAAAPANVVALTMPVDTTGNAEDDIYTNRFALNAAGLAAPVISNDISTAVRMGRLGGRIYVDQNLNSAYNLGEAGVNGVQVVLCSVDETPCSVANTVATRTTNPDGTYEFDDLFPGSYFVRQAPPANFENAGSNSAGSAGGTPVTGGFNNVTLGVGQTAVNYNVGYQPATVAGTVFNDTNGMSDTLINGTGTDAGSSNLTVYLVDEAGNIAASSDVAANGTYSLVAPGPGNYTLRISNVSTGAVGDPATTVPASLPAGWAATGEGDVSPDATVAFTVLGSQDVVRNFGIEQPPVAGATTLVSQQNPGGTLEVSIPAAAFVGPLAPAVGSGTPATDATAVTQIRFTSFPTNTTTITINGTTYTAATFPPGGVTVNVADLAGLVLDPVDGSLSPVISYIALDAAGLASAASTLTIPLVFTDSDGDGVVDGTDLDDDNDGILDTAEGATVDTDGDGIVDRLDLDSDNDGILDITEAGHTTGVDANRDGRLDGPVAADGVPDSVQANPTGGAVNYTIVDTDGDGIGDWRDLDADNDGINDVREANGTDANGDGLADGVVGPTGVRNTVPVGGLTPPDTDGDARPDWRDLDADNDGINDVVENGGSDPDNNGVVGTGAVPADGDSDGIADAADGANGTFGDGADLAPANGDNDPVPNYRDLDSDNDTVADVIEGGNGAADTDNDGTVAPSESPDADNDGIPDALDNAPAAYGDAGNAVLPEQGGADADLIPDYLDRDSDQDGLTDLEEAGRDVPAIDANNDGQIDSPVDPDGDGVPNNNGNDIKPTVFAGTSLPETGDSDGDGIANGSDFDDDNDGIPDAQEGRTTDTDGDGVPDRLDLDSDNDGILDWRESGSTTGVDANGDGRLDGPVGVDGIPDSVQANPDTATINYTIVDTDGDGVRDWRDIDSDNDGITDVIESNNVDANGDGRADGTPAANGVPASVGMMAVPPDTDGDGNEDYLDLDSDNDGINDVREANGTDANGDGIADGTTNSAGLNASVPAGGLLAVDTDSDTKPDFRDLDADNDGINDVTENGGVDDDNNGIVGTGAVPADADNDGIADVADPNGAFGDSGDPAPANGDNDPVPNFRDLDSDNDSVADVIEGGNGAADTDNNGTVTTTESPDTDGDGIVDALDNAMNTYGDEGNAALPEQGGNDTDTVPDYLDLDSDEDGQTDLEESGHDAGLLDPNGDGQIDSPSDPDGDGIPNNSGNDTQPADFGGANPPDTGDADGDGIVNADDLDDDNDGIPDAIEGYAVDTDGDGIVDRLDLDADNDGILDIRESGSPMVVDANGDGRLDGAVGIDGIPDMVQDDANGGAINYMIAETDGDSIGDWRDLDADNDGLNDVRESDGVDANGDGLADGVVGANGVRDSVVLTAIPRDTDSDTRGDWRDLDADNDGINDVTESGLPDGDNDGIVGTGNVPADGDGDGIADVVDLNSGVYGDATDGTPLNSDNDAVPNYRDLDSDNDTIADVIEGGNGSLDTDNNGTLSAAEGGVDTDGDGILASVDADPTNYGDAGNTAPPDQDDADLIPDYLDVDSDGDGITDLLDASGSLALDMNSDGMIDNPLDADGDGVPENMGNDRMPDMFGGTTPPKTLTDTDNDGIPDEVEVGIGSDPNDADSDDDGVMDGAEPQPSTDTDGDGLINVLDPDSDNDGLFDGTEMGVTMPLPDTDVANGNFVPDADPATETDPLDRDTDDGGVSDGNEDINRNGAVDGTETDPNNGSDDVPAPLDTDGDGLSDAAEVALGSDPNDADTDDDGVIDGNEPNLANDTDGDGLINVLDPDSDNDGLFDGTEMGVTTAHPDTDTTKGVFVPDADPNTRTSPLSVDTDRGGVPDGEEDTNKNGRVDSAERNPNDPADDTGNTDTDGDGIVDWMEGTGDPDGDGVPNNLDLDSDNDGIPDSVEAGDGDLATPPIDTDSDGTPDYLDLDSDADGKSDEDEGVEDPDGDGTPNYRDIDADNDTVADGGDNCYVDANADQADLDDDGLGDACDPDSDGDGFDDNLGVSGGGCATGGNHGSGSGVLMLLTVVGVAAGRRRRRAA